MTPQEHYAEAERLLAHARAEADRMGEFVVPFESEAEVAQMHLNLAFISRTVAVAQVHATLATVRGEALHITQNFTGEPALQDPAPRSKDVL